MAKSTIAARRIQADGQPFIEQDVVQLSIANYTGNQVLFTIDNVQRVLPPWDAVRKVPVAPFRIISYGNEFDIRIDFDFGGVVGDVIVDYEKLKKPQC